MARKKRKPKYAYKRILLLISFILLIISDIFNFSWFQMGKDTIKGYIIDESSPTYMVVTVYQDVIELNEKEVTYEGLVEKLSPQNPNNIMIHLIDYAAYTQPFTQVHRFLVDKGFRIIISERLPTITYEFSSK